MNIATMLPIALFCLGVTIAFFKWLHTLVIGIERLGTKFEERTAFLATRMDKVEKAMGELARTENRLDHLSVAVDDHEARLRFLENE